MSEAKDTDDKDTKTAKGKKTLSLKRTVDSGRVQPGGGGRGAKTVVVVEKKKKRSINAPGTAAKKADAAKTEEKPTPKVATPKKAAKPKRETASSKKSASGGKTLSSAEMDARARVLEEARVRDEEERKLAVVRAKEEEERRKKEAEEAAQRAKEEAERAKLEPKPEPEKKKAGKVADKSTKKPSAVSAPPEERGKPMAKRGADVARGGEERKPLEGRVKKAPAKPERVPPSRTRGDDRRHKGKLTITNALDDRQRERSLASLKRQRERLKKQNMGSQEPREKIAREVTVPEYITIQELANRMAERGVDVIKYLMKEGQMHKINDTIDADTAELIAEEFGHTVKRVSEADVEEGFIGEEDDDGTLQPRAPIVTVMGHVDHGKTSLLDALRKANVVSGEAGGITQHIGAYQVETDGKKVTFIDTPGHEAFTAMRARGAKVTDIVVLVVAADDGVMPQTVEAINHAKAAEVPMIVAINKIDKPDADPSRVRTELLQHEVIVESMSGDTLEVEVSALKGTNLDKLIDGISLQAELLELKANPDRSAEGVVVEAKLERGRGPVGTMLVQRGTLHVGDIIVAGPHWGKVRALIDDHGEHVAVAGPAKPVEVLGFGSAPEAGDQFAVVENEARAREITEYRIRKRRDVQSIGAGTGLSLEQMMSKLQEQGKKEFHLLIKGDTQGSIEAIRAALEQLGNEEVAARVVHSAVGGLTESDVSLATASGAILVGFNVRANAQAKLAAEAAGVEIRYYAVIYDLVDDVKAAMSGMLSPELRETFIGNAEILEVFNITKVGKVAGCRITEGKVERGAGVRLIRDNVVIHEGKLSTLKRFKDEVKEVVGGQECGMAFENYQDMRPGDVIECFHVEEVQRSL